MKVIYLFHEVQLFSHEYTSIENPPASTSQKRNVTKHCVLVNLSHIPASLTKYIK
jgi:hypothetical protein